jgi:hypothetical protein
MAPRGSSRRGEARPACPVTVDATAHTMHDLFCTRNDQAARVVHAFVVSRSGAAGTAVVPVPASLVCSCGILVGFPQPCGFPWPCWSTLVGQNCQQGVDEHGSRSAVWTQVARKNVCTQMYIWMGLQAGLQACDLAFACVSAGTTKLFAMHCHEHVLCQAWSHAMVRMPGSAMLCSRDGQPVINHRCAVRTPA